MDYSYEISPKKKRNIFGSLSVNTWIILANVIFFIAFFILMSTKILTLNHIALNPSNVLQGKYLWTFLTSMFMHSPNMIFHLFVNMLSLFFVGSLLQRILGQKRYLYFYLIAGLFAGLFFVLITYFFNPSALNTYAVGASGALFGLVGTLMLLTPNLPVYVMFVPIPIKLKYAAPGLLLALWGISAAADIPIGNTAHLGGLITGLIYGIYLRHNYRNKIKRIGKHFS